MYYLIDNKNKVIIGWSPKCGCTHIKMLFYFLNKIKIPVKYGISRDEAIHSLDTYEKLPKDYHSYKIILIIRNPYKRIISGFIDKYGNINSLYYNDWIKNYPNNRLTFYNFVKELAYNYYKVIDKHHFSPQLSENWEDQIMNHHNLHIFDIASIDYDFLEKIYFTKIPLPIKKYKGKSSKLSKININTKVFDLPVENIKTQFTENFYNQEIFDIVSNIYQKDLDYFKKNGFYYTI